MVSSIREKNGHKYMKHETKEKCYVENDEKMESKI